MPPLVTVGKFRWLHHGNAAHVLYETADGHHRTLCGKLLRGGSVEFAILRNVQGKCPKCMEKIRVRNRIVPE